MLKKLMLQFIKGMTMKSFVAIIFMFNLLFVNLFANDEEVSNSVDCIILEDENSIICKYIINREDMDKTVLFKWFDPNGNISRERELQIPAGHGSVYDFRYIQGREVGTWTLEVIDNNNSLKTTFTIE